MSKFKFVKRVDLVPHGANGYLEFSPMSFREGQELKDDEPLILSDVPDDVTVEAAERLKTKNAKLQRDAALKLAERIMELLKTKFVGGQISGETVTADDLLDLPPEVLAECRKAVIPEAPSPNS